MAPAVPPARPPPPSTMARSAMPREVNIYIYTYLSIYQPIHLSTYMRPAVPLLPRYCVLRRHATPGKYVYSYIPIYPSISIYISVYVIPAVPPARPPPSGIMACNAVPRQVYIYIHTYISILSIYIWIPAVPPARSPPPSAVPRQIEGGEVQAAGGGACLSIHLSIYPSVCMVPAVPPSRPPPHGIMACSMVNIYIHTYPSIHLSIYLSVYIIPALPSARPAPHSIMEGAVPRQVNIYPYIIYLSIYQCLSIYRLLVLSAAPRL